MVQNITNTYNKLPTSPPDVEMKSANSRAQVRDAGPTNGHLFRHTSVESPRYNLDISQVGVIRKYKIHIVKKSNGTENNLQMYPQNENINTQQDSFLRLITIARQHLLQRIVREFLIVGDFPRKVDPSAVVYDQKQCIYTPFALGNITSVIKFNNITDGKLRADLGAKTEQIIIKLRLIREFTMANHGSREQDVQETIRFLYCLMQAEAFEKGFFAHGRVIYDAHREEPFLNGKVFKKGFALNVKDSTRGGYEKKYTLDITPLNRLYRKATNLIDYISQELKTEKKDLTEMLRSSSEREKLFKDIGEMYVCAIQNKINFQLYGLQQSNELMFLKKNEPDIISVPNHIMSNSVGLQYPHLPMIVRRQNETKWYYHAEHLEVPMGQRVTSTHYNIDLILEADKKALMLPLEYKRFATEFKSTILGKSNKYLKSFKVGISQHMDQIDVKTAVPPMISYHCQNMQPNHTGSEPILIWDTKPHTRFVRPARLTKWAIMILDKCVTQSECRSFVDYFKKIAEQHDMHLETESEIFFCNSNLIDMRCQLELKGYNKETLQLLIVMTEKQSYQDEDLLKKLEVTTGVNSHSFGKDDVLQTACGRAATHLTLPMQIVNAKCGGRNFDVQVPSGLANGVKEKDRLISKTLRRMYVGLSIANRDKSKPKAVGLAYTVGELTDEKSIVWYQPNNVPEITELDTKLGKVIRDYEQINGFKPTEIVVYRKMLKNEAANLKKEFEKIQEGLTSHGYRPSIIMVSIKCEDNPWFLRTKIIDIPLASRQNVAPGLIVDCQDQAFYNVSNKANKGTACSVKFTIIGVNSGYSSVLTNEELKWVTNALAYANQFSNSPGPVPSIVAAADCVSTRASLAAKIAIQERLLETEEHYKQKFDGADTNEYHRYITIQLKNQVEGRHW